MEIDYVKTDSLKTLSLLKIEETSRNNVLDCDFSFYLIGYKKKKQTRITLVLFGFCSSTILFIM